ncbi:MAG TPA: primosomal protein N' [Nitrospira sp.]|nr:primosomal protein N' [Nitrospira sp.]
MVEDSAVIPSQEAPLYADVLVPRHLARSFTYAVPSTFKPLLKIGHCVIVPFGHSRVRGAVISIRESIPDGLHRDRIKNLLAIVHDHAEIQVPERLLDLAKQVAERYVAPLGQCLRLVMPLALFKSIHWERLAITDLGRVVLSQNRESREVISLLTRLARRRAGIRRSRLLSSVSSDDAGLIDDLLERQWVMRIGVHPEGEQGLRQKGVDVDGMGGPPLALRPAAAEWESRFREAMSRPHGATLRLQGSLSDRLAALILAVRQTTDRGRSALVVTGEGDRAAWLAGKLLQAGIPLFACLHHDVSETAKAQAWRRCQESGPHVVVGTRASVFMPLSSLGLIWVECVEDHALKEPQEPRYHAVEVARMRAKPESTVVVLASRHSLVDSDSSAEAEPLYRCPGLETPPKIEVVDLRPLGKKIVLSPPLVDALGETIVRKERSVLFQNRKGYAGALVCQDCGQVPRCPSCQVALVYHRHTSSLSCSYCGGAVAAGQICSFCGGHRLHLVGHGTERVEEEAKRLFPSAAVLRADGETMRTHSQARSIVSRIKAGAWDILVGTQAVLRDYMVPRVALVGAVHPDAGLSLPDFRAAERTYLLLCEAAALSLPASEGGRMIIQSYLPSHHAIQAVAQQSDFLFTSEELSQRQGLGYPPWTNLVAVLVSGPTEALVESAARTWAERLAAAFSSVTDRPRPPFPSPPAQATADYSVLGPVPPPVKKLRGRFRRQILVKSAVREHGLHAVRSTIPELEKRYKNRGVKFDVDVDPIDVW